LRCGEDGTVRALDILDVMLDLVNVLPDLLDLLKELVHPPALGSDTNIIGTIIFLVLSLKTIIPHPKN
jgi:hypothetical protein